MPAAAAVIPSPVIELAQPAAVEAGSDPADTSAAPAIPGSIDPTSRSVLRPAVSDAPLSTYGQETKFFVQDTTPEPTPVLAASVQKPLPRTIGPPVPSSDIDSPTLAGSFVVHRPPLQDHNLAPAEDTVSENVASLIPPQSPSRNEDPASFVPQAVVPQAFVPQVDVPADPEPRPPTNSVEPNLGTASTLVPITSQANLQSQPADETSTAVLVPQMWSRATIDPNLIKSPAPQSSASILPNNSAAHVLPASQDVLPKSPTVASQSTQKLAEQRQFTEILPLRLPTEPPTGAVSTNNFVSAFRSHTSPSSSCSPASEPPASSQPVKDARDARAVSGPAAAASKSDSTANCSGSASPQEPLAQVPVPGGHSQTASSAAANGGAALVNSAVNSLSEDPPAPGTKAPLATPDPPAPQAPAAGPVQVAHVIDRMGQTEMHIDLRTSAFGSVEVHTVVRDSQVGVAVGSERGDLKTFLASEVPGLQAAFRQQDLRFDAIHFLRQGTSVNAGLSGGTDSQSRSFRHGHAPGGFSPLESPSVSLETETPRITSGLSVHA